MNRICMCFDDAYILPGLITLKSLKLNSKVKFNLTLINVNSSLNSCNENLVLEWCKLNGIEVEIVSVVSNSLLFKVNTRIPISSYGRIHAIYMLKNPFVYLDSDLLASEDWDIVFVDLEHLVQNNRTMLASLERNSHYLNSRNMARQLAGERYFSAAVFGLNPSQINPTLFMSRVFELLGKYEDNFFWAHDQDVLNYIFAEELTEMNSLFNSNIWNRNTVKPRILHFDGFFKPWKLSTPALAATLVIAAGYDLLDFVQHGARFFRVDGFMQHKKIERSVRSELQQIRDSLGHSNSKETNLEAIVKTTFKQVLKHLSKRVKGSNAATNP